MRIANASALGCLLVAVFPFAALAVGGDGGTHNEEEIDFSTLVDAITIEDLLNVPIAGTLAASRSKVSPVSVTVISAADIRRTPARNLMDLLEVYVPGALFMHHSDGLQYGIRGIVNDRKNKILVLVNGFDVGIKAHGGDTADTEQWDLTDIERIEIIRGPGSVTYGPGAIAGVINIITKTAETSLGARAWAQYLSSYNELGAGASYGGTTGDFSYLVYASLTFAGGVENPRAYDVRPAGTIGYLGYPADKEGLDTVPSNEYYATIRYGKLSPLIKAAVDFKYGKNWNLWARYVESGSAFSPQAKAQFGFAPTAPPVRKMFEFGSSRENRQVMVSVENEQPVASFLAVKSAIGFMSSDSEIRTNRAFSANPQNGTNFLLNFAEHLALGRSVLSFSFLDTFAVAVGGEYRYLAFTPGWGDTPKAFVMGDSQNIINGLTNDRIVTQGLAPSTFIFAGDDGWDSHGASAVGEANLGFHRLFSVIASARYDYNTYLANDLFSPRVAVLSDFDSLGTLKVIAQRSLRMPNSEQLYEARKSGKKPQIERLQGIEAAYDLKMLDSKFEVIVTGFINDLQILSWNSALTARTTETTGNAVVWGGELEARYVGDTLGFGVNHSLVKLLSWKLADGIQQGGFSYSDLRRTTGTPPVTLTSTGHDINNWSRNSTKLNCTASFLDKRLEVSANAQIYWGFEGIKDQLNAIEKAIVGTTYETRGNEIIAELRRKGAGNADLRVNLAVNYKLTEGTRLTLYGANIVPINSKRYFFDSIATGPYPVRVRWIEEPTAFGVRIETNY